MTTIPFFQVDAFAERALTGNPAAVMPLERWLDEQIRFDKEWETKVVERILHNLSLLFERTFTSVQDLNRYRKEIAARLKSGGAAPQPA